jgi:queuosine precursor transporter
MAAVVVLSNVLVQHPFAVRLGQLDLADLLTWGAFSYPLAFLVTDITNRLLGPNSARRVVFVGFAVAVLLSVWASTPRIAIASGTAFLVGQLLDVGVFNRLRQRAWWKAPAFSSLIGSAADTLIFFTLAFAPALVLLGANDPFAIEPAPLLGLYPVETQRWISWAMGDFAVKLLLAAVALIPYRIVVGWFIPLRPAEI